MPLPRIIVIGTIVAGTAAAAGFFFAYRYFAKSSFVPSSKRPRKTPDERWQQTVTTSQQQDQSYSPSKPEPQISASELEHLVGLLASSNTTKFIKIMKTIVQFSNSNNNFVRCFLLFE